MKTLEMKNATAPLSSYAKHVSKEPVVVTIGGKPVAALVPIENADLETVTLSTHPKFLAIIERSRARQKSQGGISSKEMRRRLGLKPAGKGA
jgi:antitoxin (DNA-binding transcriptional repressor) of toxin-antitoxin stability system